MLILRPDACSKKWARRNQHRCPLRFDKSEVGV
jgi:hypothetical protein